MPEIERIADPADCGGKRMGQNGAAEKAALAKNREAGSKDGYQGRPARKNCSVTIREEYCGADDAEHAGDLSQPITP